MMAASKTSVMPSPASQLYEDYQRFIDEVGNAVLTKTFEQYLPGDSLSKQIKVFNNKQLSDRRFKKDEIKLLKENAGPGRFEFSSLLLIILKFGKISPALKKILKQLQLSSKEFVGKTDGNLELRIIGKFKNIKESYEAIIRELQEICNEDDLTKLKVLNTAINTFFSTSTKKFEDDRQKQKKHSEKMKKMANNLYSVKRKAVNLTKDLYDMDSLSKDEKDENLGADSPRKSKEPRISQDENLGADSPRKSKEPRISKDDENESPQKLQLQIYEDGNISRNVPYTQQVARNNERNTVNQQVASNITHHGSGNVEENKNKFVFHNCAVFIRQ